MNCHKFLPDSYLTVLNFLTCRSYGREWGSLIPGAPSGIPEERDIRKREALELTLAASTLHVTTDPACMQHPMFTTTTKDLLSDGTRPNVEEGLDRKTRQRILAHAYGLAPPDATPLPVDLGATATTLRRTFALTS